MKYTWLDGKTEVDLCIGGLKFRVGWVVAVGLVGGAVAGPMAVHVRTRRCHRAHPRRARLCCACAVLLDEPGETRVCGAPRGLAVFIVSAGSGWDVGRGSPDICGSWGGGRVGMGPRSTACYCLSILSRNIRNLDIQHTSTSLDPHSQPCVRVLGTGAFLREQESEPRPLSEPIYWRFLFLTSHRDAPEPHFPQHVLLLSRHFRGTELEPKL